MLRRRPVQRLTITIFVVLSLLFAQMVLANYVCPPQQAQGDPEMAMEMAPGEPCEGMATMPDEAQPVLCHQHCADAPQSYDPLNVPAVTLPAIVQVLVVPLLLYGQTFVGALHARLGPERPPPDPLFLATLRLRV